MTYLDDKEIGKRLLSLREGYRSDTQPNKKLNQVKFGVEIGILNPGDQNKLISRLENGDQRISLEQLCAYSQKCGVSMEWILSGDTEKKEDVDARPVLKEEKASPLTYPMVAKMLDRLTMNGSIAVHDYKHENYNSYFVGLPRCTISVYDAVLAHICETYGKMRSLCNDQTIGKDMFEDWEKGFLDKVNRRLLNIKDFNEVALFVDNLKQINGIDPDSDVNIPLNPSTVIFAMQCAIHEREHSYKPTEEDLDKLQEEKSDDSREFGY